MWCLETIIVNNLKAAMDERAIRNSQSDEFVRAATEMMKEHSNLGAVKAQ